MKLFNYFLHLNCTQQKFYCINLFYVFRKQITKCEIILRRKMSFYSCKCTFHAVDRPKMYCDYCSSIGFQNTFCYYRIKQVSKKQSNHFLVFIEPFEFYRLKSQSIGALNYFIAWVSLLPVVQRCFEFAVPPSPFIFIVTCIFVGFFIFCTVAK